MITFFAKYAIIGVFGVMFVNALWGVVLTQKLSPYMSSRSWTVRKWSFLFLALAQTHGILKTLFSDHHFNVNDFLYFLELLGVFVGLNIANYILLNDWRRFPLFERWKRRAQ